MHWLSLLDIRSLFILCIIVFPLLLSSGLFSYLVLGIKIASGRVRKAPEKEVKKVIVAIKLTMKLVIISGMIGFTLAAISILASRSSVEELGGAASLASISVLYSLFGLAFLLPVQSRVEALLIDMGSKIKDHGSEGSHEEYHS